jgi:oligoendopeptidase F
MATALRSRDEIEAQYRWDTASIYRDDPSWEADFRAVEDRLPLVVALQGTLGLSGQALLAALRQRDEVGVLVERLLLYAKLRRDEDTSHSENQARFDRAIALEARFQAASAFFTPEILAIDDSSFDVLFQQAPALEAYRFSLHDLRRRRAHIRSAEVEAVLAQVSELVQVPGTIFTALNDADLSFGVIRDASGSEIALSHGRVWSLLEHPDREVRRAAFEQYMDGYASHRTTFAATLSSAVRAHVFEARARGYSSALEAALDPDDIPPSVYHTLIDTVHRHLPIVHRYLGLRKQILDLNELHYHDLLVPLSSAPLPRMTYDQARDIVIEALTPLGPEYGAALRRGLFDERWVDVYETSHKRGGGYSSSAYGTKPFILLNWQDTLTDLSVLAHELGHAMHTYFTGQAQPYCTSNYTIFVAEVASTCNEALLFAHLLRTTSDPDQKRGLLSLQLRNIAETLVETTMGAEFEREIHMRIERGEALAATHFTELDGQLRTQYRGPDVVVNEPERLFWAIIPHFYRYNFYVYKYATGISAGLALAHEILDEGQPAVERYLNFLRGGGSQSSITLLKHAGVDLTTPQPVEQAMRSFSALVDQLDALTGEQPVA